ncbi:MAG: type II secretion system protein N, partial [Gallionella sp.]
LWIAAGIFSMAITVLAFFPASFLAPLVEKNSQGRLTLGDAQGTVWHGSAFIGSAPGGNVPVTPLLPGRFEWRVSPLLLLGNVEIELSNADALSNTLRITGNWHELHISPAAITLPAERLASLGAPLNTIQPSGQMRLSWQPLQMSIAQDGMSLTGQMDWALQDIASRLSPIKPLGAYNLHLNWQGAQATVLLTTLQGSLLLDGAGSVNNGRLVFSGTAQAAPQQQEKLANLLNLLGQRRDANNPNIIALEFK